MEQSQWKLIVQIINRVCRLAGRLAKATYSDALIFKFYYWGVKHDRPMTWAVDPLHSNRLFRPRRWPSISQLNRRIASERFVRLALMIEAELRQTDLSQQICLDGKALCVSPVSQDRDAARGHIPGGMGKGYKLHAMVARDGKIADFSVRPLNCHEMPIAREMIARIDRFASGTKVFGDGNYDSHVLHKEIDKRGGWLITRLRGRARHPVTLRQMGKARRDLIDLWDTHRQSMEALYRKRDHIERIFGQLTCIPGLLSPLPAFIRGLKRVRRWVGAKITLYHARLEAKKRRGTTG